MSLKPVPHSIGNRLEGIKGEKYGTKLVTLVNSFYTSPRRRRTSSNPSGRVPSSLIKFSSVERTVCAVHLITDSSRTHGTWPDSEDSTPSAELSVRLLTSASSIMFSFFLSRPLFPFRIQPCKLYGCPDRSGRTMRAHYTWGRPIWKLNITTLMASCQPDMHFSFHICLFFTIICIDMT